MWKLLALCATLVFVAFLVPKIYKHYVLEGYHGIQFNHYPGPCRRLPNIEHGSEHINLLSDGKVLITSGLRFSGSPVYKNVKGKLFFFDLDKPDALPREVAIKGDIDLNLFNPLGMTSWKDEKTGDQFVYVVNIHQPKGTMVEEFRFVETEMTLYHIETLLDPNFIFLNSITAVGKGQFYFTNFYNTWMGWELTLQLYRGNAGFYSYGESSKIVAEGMLLPNGIAISPDGKYVHVSHIFEREMRTYRRNADNSLDFVEATPVYMALDNLVVDKKTGDVYTAGGMLVPKIWEYIESPHTVLSPSKVLRMKVKDGHVTDIIEVFADDGKLHSAGTVALYYKNKLIIGSVASYATLCDVKYM